MHLRVQRIGDLKAQIEQRRLRRSLATLGQDTTGQEAGPPEEDAQDAHLTRVMAQARDDRGRLCLAINTFQRSKSNQSASNSARAVGSSVRGGCRQCFAKRPLHPSPGRHPINAADRENDSPNRFAKHRLMVR